MPYMTKRKTTSDGIVPIGSNLFGICSSGASSVNKSVTMPDFDVLVTGVTIHVYFSNGNTASSPTLTVGSTSGIAIKRNGSSSGKWSAGSVVSFTYDGTNWIQNDSDDSGKTYSISISDHTITLTDSDGGTQTVTVPDNDTHYGLSFSNGTLSVVENGGSPSVNIPDTVLKYTIDAPDGVRHNSVIQNDVDNNTATGGYAHAEGYDTEASGDASHAEGQNTTASGQASHAEGYYTVASGDYNAHAEGSNTTASGRNSHAEGFYTTASGESAHAEGSRITYDDGQTYHYSEASALGSHVEGGGCVASGKWSHAEGECTIAQGNAQKAIGKWNVAQGSNPSIDTDYAVILGNGTENNRSNALTINWLGEIVRHLKWNGSSIPSAIIDGTHLIKDAVGEWVARFGAFIYDTASGVRDAGAVGAMISARHPTANVENNIMAIVNPDGTREYFVSDTARFRAAIGIPNSIESSGTSSSWQYRNWRDGRVEAWSSYTGSATATTVWASPIRYKDITIAIPSGIFSSAPTKVFATSSNSQAWVVDANATSATSISVRLATVSSGNITPSINLYCVS